MVLITTFILSDDGNILHEEIVSGIAKAGADVVATGASVFGTENYSQTIAALKAFAN